MKKKINWGTKLKKNSSNWIIVILYAFIGTVCVPNILSVSGGSIWYTNSFFACFFFVINLSVVKRIYPYYKETIKRKKIYAILFALCLSAALHFGASLEADGYVTFTDIWLWISILLFGLYLALFIHIGWEQLPMIAKKLVEKQKTTEDETESVPKKTTIKQLCQKVLDTPWMTWVSLFILWLPTFLAFFPGAFVYDAQDEYEKVVTGIYTMHHPLMHVLLLGGIIHFIERCGLSANIGIACYTLFQMIIVSGVFTFFLFVVRKWKMRCLYRGILLIVIGIFPVFPMFAVCSAKDTLFTTFLFFSMLFLLKNNMKEEYKEFNLGRIIIFIFLSILSMMFRNNGIYAYVLWGIIVLVCVNKRKKNILSMLFSILFFLLFSNMLKVGLDASSGKKQEMLTVPIQQLARTYYYMPEAFNEEEKKTLFEILPENAIQLYDPQLSDDVKGFFANDVYKSNPKKYQKLWFEIGLREPFTYINAWFLTSYGYWYPDMIINVYKGHQMFTFQYQNSSYFEFETELPGYRHSRLPLLEEWYRNISLELFQQKVPVLSMLFSPGFLFWVYAFYWIWFLREKEKRIFGFVSIVFCLWVTVILGPTVLVRYVLIFWFIVLLLPVLQKENKKEYQNEERN